MFNVIDQINQIPIFNIMSVRGYCVNINGTLRTFVFAEDIAREGGLSRIKIDYRRPLNAPDNSGAEQEYYQYETIRWKEFNKYVNDSMKAFENIAPDVVPLIQLPIHAYSYIPCELALVVLMHLESEKARNFQVTLASIIMPEIQSNTIRYFESLMLEQQKQIQYYEDFMNPDNLYSTTEIAKDFGFSAQQLNTFLHMIGIIYQVNGTWQVYQSLARRGYTRTKLIQDGNGNSKPCTYWTEGGRYFIHSIMAQYGFEKGLDNTMTMEEFINDYKRRNNL